MKKSMGKRKQSLDSHAESVNSLFDQLNQAAPGGSGKREVWFFVRGAAATSNAFSGTSFSGGACRSLMGRGISSI
ncbi:hypothetical protein [Nitrosospira sp. Nsp18]|uniref:hypothetical protein n=1 Tax=Nitrosospira sp. Nsp18 TaxID=1855334 RepID=UPI00115F8E9E|nr:hypothetical protein [Nitrosospira sp. Nsp18]